MSERVNLQKSLSAVNEKIAKTFDESGVPRSFTVPYIEGQPTGEHIAAVSQAATKSGGLSASLLTTYHHGTGKGWGSGEGHTVGHSAEKLRNTILPNDDENAKAAIAAAQSHLNNISKLIGKDNPATQTAQGQLDLVKKTDAAGMNLMDFGVLITQLLYGPNQAVAKAYSGAKDGGHQPGLRAPMAESADESQQPAEGDKNDQEDAGEAQGDSQASQGSPTPQADSAASAAPATQG